MILDELVDKVPEYKEFLTVNELDASATILAEDFDKVEKIKIGESREGRPISYLKIGDGPKNALLFAFPHPNEPIGSMTVEYFSSVLAENPDIVDELGYTWYLIKTIDPDGWLHTGDAGIMDADGYVYIQDRIKDMIISGGENVYPAEVESAIYGHPAILEVAVIGIPSEKWGEEVKACVVAKPGMEIEEGDVIAYTRERIAPFKCPKSIDIIPEMPRNASGKILRRQLRAPYWEGQERQVN